MIPREALSRLRTAARERFGPGARLRFDWDLDMVWDADRGVTAGDGWIIWIEVQGIRRLLARGASCAAAIDDLSKMMEKKT